jgi:hypothetical protein
MCRKAYVKFLSSWPQSRPFGRPEVGHIPQTSPLCGLVKTCRGSALDYVTWDGHVFQSMLRSIKALALGFKWYEWANRGACMTAKLIQSTSEVVPEQLGIVWCECFVMFHTMSSAAAPCGHKGLRTGQEDLTVVRCPDWSLRGLNTPLPGGSRRSACAKVSGESKLVRQHD